MLNLLEMKKRIQLAIDRATKQNLIITAVHGYSAKKMIFTFECENHHIITCSYQRLDINQGCRKCSVSLTAAEVNEQLRSRGLRMAPATYTGTSYRASFTCKESHVFEAYPRFILAGGKCTTCSGFKHLTINDLRAIAYKNNFTCVSTKYVNDKTSYEFKCPVGHTVFRVYSNIRDAGLCCSECKKLNLHDFKDLQAVAMAAAYPEKGICMSLEYLGSKVDHLWKCQRTDHPPFLARYNNVQQGSWCDLCWFAGRRSRGEREMLEFVQSITTNTINSDFPLGQRNRSPEIDIYIDADKTGFEYNGLYRHSEKMGRDRNYHVNKLSAAEAAGIKLFTFWSSEWGTKNDIVKNIIRNGLHAPFIKYNARDCAVAEISAKEGNIFLDKNHLQGPCRNAVYFGLKYNDDLVEVLTLRKTTYTGKTDSWEIGRLATVMGIRVRGGFSKLLKTAKSWLLTKGINELYTFADRRYSKGDVYLKNGFEFLGETEPGYYFTKDFTKLVHRYTLRKTKECPVGMTNDVWRASQGWTKVWDCGQLKFRIKF